MMCFHNVLWDGYGLWATLMKFFSNICIATSICAAHFVHSRTVWWVFLFGFLGVQVTQLLSGFSGAYFNCYHIKSSWMVWFRWLLYCHKLNEILYAILFLELPLIRFYYSFHLFYDYIKLWHDKSCIVNGELIESATGRVVWPSVASVDGVQPWLIAPGCMAQCPLWSMMKPTLAETYFLCLLLDCLMKDNIWVCILPCKTAMPIYLLDPFKPYMSCLQPAGVDSSEGVNEEVVKNFFKILTPFLIYGSQPFF